MEIKWTNEAIESLRDNPYFLTSFIEEVKLYKRVILKGKFALYYDIIDEEELVIIKFFRSTKQKPL
ncbi:hypothetical protein [Capnocytophaga leadbetteri]|jgi:hypothetical protein|uniref:hypothetical protein n=1 Tax=Capnocytophaga leadbetteri TaxID=327575 RepID=UPI0028D51B9B|nr:hypothetical protein [Capnocytophaga leadbetteri]